MNDPQFNPYDQPQQPPEYPYYPEEPRKSRGCLFYGCIAAIIMAVLGLILMGIFFYVLYSYYTGLLRDYTSTAPITIPKVEITDDQRKALDERVEAFKAALDKGEAAEIVLNSDELNALIAENEAAKDKVYVTLKGDKVGGLISFPLGEIGLPGTKGRYLNGSGTFKVSLQEGRLLVLIQDLEVNGKNLPPEVKAQIATQNVAENFNRDPKNSAMLRKFESIAVKDGLVTVKAAAKSQEESPEAKEKPKDDEGKPKAKDDAEPPKAKADEEAPKAAESAKGEAPEPAAPKAAA
jgi:hypothetical protein